MADSCCKSETTCCEPPALVLPGRKLVQALPASGKAGGYLLPQGRACSLTWMNPRYRLILWDSHRHQRSHVRGRDGGGQVAGSQALKADALDFLADTVTYGVTPCRHRRKPSRTCASAALAKRRVAVRDGAFRVVGFGSTVYQTLILGLAES